MAKSSQELLVSSSKLTRNFKGLKVQLSEERNSAIIYDGLGKVNGKAGLQVAYSVFNFLIDNKNRAVVIYNVRTKEIFIVYGSTWYSFDDAVVKALKAPEIKLLPPVFEIARAQVSSEKEN